MAPALPLRVGTQVLLPLLKSRCRSRAGGQQQHQLPLKRPQPLARKGRQPLARKGTQLRPRALAQGTARAQKAIQGITQVQPRACKAPRAIQSAHCLGQAAMPAAPNRAAKRQLPQPLARKRPRQTSEKRAAFGDHVSETEHLEHHAGSKAVCIRCEMQQNRKAYEALTLQGRWPWISSGFNSGLWGLGRAACAEYLASGRKCDGARCSKFATFQVRPKTRKWAKFLIEQHHGRKSHRAACGAGRKEPKMAAVPPQPLACPATCPSEGLGALSAEDAALLKGNVPSLSEWRAAWAVISEAVAIRQASRIEDKRRSSNAHTVNRTRKRYRKQLCVMADVIISRAFGQARSISLSLDERKYRNIVRVRADLPSAARSDRTGSSWRQVCASGFSYSGVLGALDCSKKHALDFEDDHAVTAVKQIGVCSTKFCTSLGRVPGVRQIQRQARDEGLKTHVMSTVLSLAADGASKERRALFLAARDMFPNLLILIRDPAHAIRIAATSSHQYDAFGQVWRELFDGKHALVTDLTNSHKWHYLIVAIQEDTIRVVARPGVPQPLAGYLRNVAFAKQRWDSTAGPAGKMALTLLPAATLLAHIASDRRHERDQRERATALLNTCTRSSA